MAQEVTFMMLRVVLFEIYRHYRLRLAPGATVAKNTIVTTKPAAVPIIRLPREQDGRPRAQVEVRDHPAAPVPAGAASAVPAGAASAVAAPPAAAPQWGQPTEIPETSAYRDLVIAYGSNFGTCKGLAERFAERSHFHGYESDAITLNELAESPPRAQPWLLVVMTSTYTSNPPTNAATFRSWLERTPPGGEMWRNCRYLVWGLGNTQWNAFMAFPRYVDKGCPSSAPRRLPSSRTATWARPCGSACTVSGMPASGRSCSSCPGRGRRRPRPRATPPRRRPRAC